MLRSNSLLAIATVACVLAQGSTFDQPTVSPNPKPKSYGDAGRLANAKLKRERKAAKRKAQLVGE